MLVTDLSNSFHPVPKNKKDVKSTGIGQKNNNKETVTDEVYNAVLERDKGKCRLCGTNKDLQAHHILYRSERKDLINEPTNMIMLCMKCHGEVHKNKHKWQPELLNIVKEKSK